eukprot:1752172-Prymnesium_polylepis.1
MALVPWDPVRRRRTSHTTMQLCRRRRWERPLNSRIRFSIAVSVTLPQLPQSRTARRERRPQPAARSARSAARRAPSHGASCVHTRRAAASSAHGTCAEGWARRAARRCGPEGRGRGRASAAPRAALRTREPPVRYARAQRLLEKVARHWAARTTHVFGRLRAIEHVRVRVLPVAVTVGQAPRAEGAAAPAALEREAFAKVVVHRKACRHHMQSNHA